jgi:hypothetical protein
VGSRPYQINRYVVTGDINAPRYGVLVVIPVLSEKETEVEIDELSRIRGVEIKSLIATNTITGSLCYRLFDNKHSSQYKILTDEYKIEMPKEKTDYLL